MLDKNGGWKVRAHINPAKWQSNIELHIFHESRDGGKWIVEDVDSISLKPHNDLHVSEPAMHLNQESGQVLFDSLWDCGFRPSRDVRDQDAQKILQAHINSLEKTQDKHLNLLEIVISAKNA